MICQKCKKEAPPAASYCPYCGRLLSAPPRPRTRRGNEQGTAYRRGRTWTAQWTVDTYTDDKGAYHVIRKAKGGFKTKKEAQDYCVLRTTVPEKAAPRLIDYWRQYDARLQKLSKDKITAYKIAWKRWEPLWYHQVDRITSADLQRVVSSATSTFYPARDMKSLMTNLFKLAGADGFASKDVPSFIELPRLEETKREAFSDLEQAALWRAWENGCVEASLPLVMIYTGMMPAEMMSLQNDMIHLEDKQIIGAGHKTAVRKAAPIYLPDAIIPVLDKVISLEPQNKRLQPFPKSEQYFYAQYYSALSSANVRKLTPYCCRHTTATALAITEGIAPQTVRQIMRWSTTRMLDRYAHPSDADIHAAVNTIGSSTESSAKDTKDSKTAYNLPTSDQQSLAK